MGGLPNNTETNPKALVKAITTKSDITTQDPIMKPVAHQESSKSHEGDQSKKPKKKGEDNNMEVPGDEKGNEETFDEKGGKQEREVDNNNMTIPVQENKCVDGYRDQKLKELAQIKPVHKTKCGDGNLATN
ncbi:hypothetical protein L1987_49369 [Smallanthus sonchifolius]|uniref:Uncharacterized protein n=1 Tax=Smallanthus sonchifolius TaxID=185202 RepID=A0ACB9FW60_9ASTR|nr:hypothetical protein L1987_49369 [Smallanthus sonchifolius]